MGGRAKNSKATEAAEKAAEAAFLLKKYGAQGSRLAAQSAASKGEAHWALPCGGRPYTSFGEFRPSATNREIHGGRGPFGPESGLRKSFVRCRYPARHAYSGCGLDAPVAAPNQAVMGCSVNGSSGSCSWSPLSEALLATRRVECRPSMCC